jgi:hypothetical protein
VDALPDVESPVDQVPPLLANARRGQVLSPLIRSLGREAVLMMSDRLVQARGIDADGEVDEELAVPLGANERLVFWQACRWINSGIDQREPLRMLQAVTALQEVARDGSLPLDLADVPAEALRCSDDDLREHAMAFCEVFGPRHPSER